MSNAVWFRPDTVMPSYLKLDVLGDLEKVLLRHDWYITTVKSNITRGQTYNSNIYKIIHTGRFSEGIEHNHSVPHGAGSGADPLLAVLDAAYLTRCKESDLLAMILEVEVWLLNRAVARIRHEEALMVKLENTLDLLSESLMLVNLPK